MCEPASATLAVIAIGATVASTAVAVYGQAQAASAQSDQAKYQAAVARNNAVLAERAATDARQRGEVTAANQALKGRQLIGAERATFANNGVEVGTGSALDLTTDTAGQNKLDELTIRSNAEREALGFEAQGMNYNAAAGLDTARAGYAQDAALTAGVGTALSGASSVAGKWYNFNNNGAFSSGPAAFSSANGVGSGVSGGIGAWAEN